MGADMLYKDGLVVFKLPSAKKTMKSSLLSGLTGKPIPEGRAAVSRLVATAVITLVLQGHRGTATIRFQRNAT